MADPSDAAKTAAPVVAGVTSCGDCPLANVHSDHDSYDPPWCGHPLASEITIEPEGLPRRCPLRGQPLLVRLEVSRG